MSWFRIAAAAPAMVVTLAVGLPFTAVARPPCSASDDGPRVEFSFRDPKIAESSGMAASRRHPGVYWTHNDSDDGPYVYAVDSTGKTVATVTMAGVTPRDVEAISIGPSGQIWVADIGDNFDGRWPEVWIYRFTEPAKLRDTTVNVVRYRVQYADGPRNAEAMMVHPRTGRVYIASKNEHGGNLYEGPAVLSETGINTFHKIDRVPWVTDGAFSPDGSRLLLRGYFWATEYRWRDGEELESVGQLNVPVQEQGESVTYVPDGRAVLLGSEGEGAEVWRVPLTDDLLPDDAASATTDPSASAGGAAPGPGDTRNAKPRDFTVGVTTFLALTAGVLILRRIVRSRTR